MDIKDTSEDYDDLVDYESTENTLSTINEFIDEEPNKSKYIRPKVVDPEFPESWQNLIVSFRNFEDYAKFMKLIDQAPAPKVKNIVYSKEQESGIFKFAGD